MDNNEIVNEQINYYYNKGKTFSKSHSYSTGLSKINTKPRTAPNKIINYDEIYIDGLNKDNNKDNDDNDSDDDFFFNFKMKKRNFSISNGNTKEALAYKEQLPKKVDKTMNIINDTYDDLSKIEHSSILNEMRHFYITFTSRLELNESDEISNNSQLNKSDEISNNSQELNNKENELITSNELINNNIEKISNLNHSIKEGISFKPVPLICINDINTVGDITCDEKNSSEDILKQIQDNNNNNNNNDDNDNNYIYNNINNKNISTSSTSFNESNLLTAPRRRSSLFQFIFNRTRSRNNSSYISSSQVSSNECDISINSINNSTKINRDNSYMKSFLSERESSSSLLFNISESSYVPSLVSSTNYDINDILNIGINTPILEESRSLQILKAEDNKKKSRDKKNKKISTSSENSHNLNDVFKAPDIELTGRKSFENNVINMFLAEKLRKLLPPYYRECQNWELVYSIIDHGSSISTLLSNCEETHLTGSFLLAILDTEGYIYGAYLSEIIHISKRFYGSGECFLWRLNNENKQIDYYRGSSENQYHIVTDKSFIAFGGGNGDFGLYISNDLLNGYTTYCPTYNNPPLTPESKFECVNIELWGFNFS